MNFSKTLMNSFSRPMFDMKIKFKGWKERFKRRAEWTSSCNKYWFKWFGLPNTLWTYRIINSMRFIGYLKTSWKPLKLRHRRKIPMTISLRFSIWVIRRCLRNLVILRRNWSFYWKLDLPLQKVEKDGSGTRNLSYEIKRMKRKMYWCKINLRPQANENNLLSERLFSKKKKAKWVTWPSTFVDSLKQIIDITKVKTRVKFDAFRATHPKPLPIPTPRIKKIDEGLQYRHAMGCLLRNWSYQFLRLSWLLTLKK